MCSDNILYYSYVAFETYKDLAEHLKQDATKKFIKCASASIAIHKAYEVSSSVMRLTYFCAQGCVDAHATVAGTGPMTLV